MPPVPLWTRTPIAGSIEVIDTTPSFRDLDAGVWMVTHQKCYMYSCACLCFFNYAVCVVILYIHKLIVSSCTFSFFFIFCKCLCRAYFLLCYKDDVLFVYLWAFVEYLNNNILSKSNYFLFNNYLFQIYNINIKLCASIWLCTQTS